MYISVMAGFVISFFLMVGEVVALRRQASKIFAHLKLLRQTRRRIRLVFVLLGIAVLFLIQPVIVAAFVVLVLNNFNPHFYVYLLQEFKQML